MGKLVKKKELWSPHMDPTFFQRNSSWIYALQYTKLGIQIEFQKFANPLETHYF